MSFKDALCDLEIHHTDGQWRIVTFHYKPNHYYRSIQHHCTAGMSGSVRKSWVGMYYYWPIATKPCYVCDGYPPEGLQALFGMLGTDG
jgi:hypothetical protein